MRLKGNNYTNLSNLSGLLVLEEWHLLHLALGLEHNADGVGKVHSDARVELGEPAENLGLVAILKEKVVAALEEGEKNKSTIE